MNSKSLFEYALEVAKEHSEECGYPVIKSETKFEIFGLHYVLLVDWDIPLLTIKEYDTEYNESSGEVIARRCKEKTEMRGISHYLNPIISDEKHKRGALF